MAHIAVLASLLLTRGASAAEDDEPSFDVTLRGGLVTSTSLFAPLGGLVGVDGHYRATPYFRAGAGVHFSRVASTSSDHYDYRDEHYSLIRFLPKFELHSRPDSIVDPFVGASVGLFYVTPESVSGPDKRPGRAGMDAGLDVGVDFHIGKHFAVGPVMSVVVPLVNNKALFSDRFGGGTYYSAFGFVIPAPLLRFQGAF